nr:hypothetical protein [Tanacetum cinerariifolium]
VPKLVLVYEDEDPKEDEFEEEENPQEEEDDTEINVEEDENELELTYPYEEDSDSLLPGLMKWDINSLFGQMASISRRFCCRETAHALVEKKGKAKDKFYGKLILKLRNEVRSTVEQGMAAMEKLVEKLGNTEDKVDCKKLKKEHKEVRTRVQAHEFYQEMIHRGFVFEERPNEAINVSIEDEMSPSSELREYPR